jgi:cytochrome d ubiquinol oxidase subunit I
MDALVLARCQFGITTVYHFFFVPMTIGITWLIAVMQTRWYRTGDDKWLRMTRFFGKLFLINFAAGVVTGIVQEFQFGMNWSEYSRFVGDIFGAPLALEALIAFFMESTFVGLWIFGWGRLPKKTHLVTIYLTAVGSTISAIFILAANSWMQNPVGAVFENGRAQLSNFLALIGNPFFLTTLPHTLGAAFVIAGGLVAGVSGYWLVRSRKEAGADEALVQSNDDLWRPVTRFGAWIVIVAACVSLISGDIMGKVEAKYQPAKLAASEGITCTMGVDCTAEPLHFSLVAVPDGNGFAKDIIKLPGGLMSWLAFGTTDAVVPGMQDVANSYAQNGFQMSDGTGLVAPSNDLQASCQGDATCQAIAQAADNPIPNWLVIYYAFRVMVAMCFVALILGILTLVFTRKGHLPPDNKLWTVLMALFPLYPLLANSCGWITAEIGRQPWIVYGVLPTSSANSPTVSGLEIGITMTLYTLIYAVVAVLVVKLFLKVIREGLPNSATPPKGDAEAEDAPLAFAY